jgi:hypothetical protein
VVAQVKVNQYFLSYEAWGFTTTMLERAPRTTLVALEAPNATDARVIADALFEKDNASYKPGDTSAWNIRHMEQISMGTFLKLTSRYNMVPVRPGSSVMCHYSVGSVNEVLGEEAEE